MKKPLLTLLLFCFTLMSGALYAQSAKLSIQGVLRNSNGTALENGQYEITFSLYTEAATGTALWSDTFNDVEVEGGIYSVILGDGAPLSVPFDEPYYLGVAIEGGTELIPRAPLTSSPYALSLIGDDNIFPNSGNVGIGDPDPTFSKLSVMRGNGKLGLDADENANNNAKITTEADGLVFHTDGNNTAHIFSGTAGEKMRINTNGNVGIGTDDPQNTLHIVGGDEQIKVEGINNANIGFYKTSANTIQGGSLGFDNANNGHLVLDNTIGKIRIKGNGIELSPNGTAETQVNSDASVNGQVNINKNGQALTLNGTLNTYIGFHPQGTIRKGFVGFGTPNNDNLHLTNESANGDIVIGSTGGKVTVTDALYVTGWNQVQVNYDIWRFANGGLHNNNPGSWPKFNITTPNHVRGAGYWIFSDERIKKDISISEAKSDLATLNKIEVTDYRYIDPSKYGTKLKKGVIAQQVREVYPEAITIAKDYIPNLLSYPTTINKTATQREITMEKPHNLSVGDKVKCINKQFNFDVTVSAIIDDHTFSVDHSYTNISEEVLFYGKEVDDFHTVDYDQIFTLCVSAVQALDRKVKALETENTKLRTKAAQSINVNQELKADLETLSKRINAVEHALEN